MKETWEAMCGGQILESSAGSNCKTEVVPYLIKFITRSVKEMREEQQRGDTKLVHLFISPQTFIASSEIFFIASAVHVLIEAGSISQPNSYISIFPCSTVGEWKVDLSVRGSTFQRFRKH